MKLKTYAHQNEKKKQQNSKGIKKYSKNKFWRQIGWREPHKNEEKRRIIHSHSKTNLKSTHSQPHRNYNKPRCYLVREKTFFWRNLMCSALNVLHTFLHKTHSCDTMQNGNDDSI